MFRKTLFALPILFGAAGLLAVPSRAQANDATRFAMITIENTTNIVIRYQVKWGDGDWVSFALLPGRYMNHYHALDHNGRAPTPYIRFDGVLGDGDVTHLNYKLDFYGSYWMGYYEGKIYRFRTRGGGRYLDLTAR